MSKRPLYEEIKETLIARLASDQWRPGELLPSELKLAETFEVSQGTVRRALDELVSQGLLARHQGRGTAVTKHTPFGFFHLFRDDGARELPESKTLRISVNAASRSERDALELEPAKKVIRITRVRYLNLEPKIFEWIPDNEFLNMDQLIAKIIKKFSKKVGVYPHWEGWFDIGHWEEYQKSLEKIRPR